MGASLGGGSGRGRTRRGGGKQFNDINVTPLVDVMLVLLIIFMVTAPMLTAGVEVELPDSKAGPVGDAVEPLSVSIQAGGVIYIQKSKIQAENLIPKLKAIAGEKYDTRIFVRADRTIGYGEVMRVVGDISYAGFKKVALITENSTPSR
jgi:biopolymer transport protein TolR